MDVLSKIRTSQTIFQICIHQRVNKIRNHVDSLSAVKKMVDIVKHSVYSMVYKVKFMLDHSKIIVENVSKYLHYDKLVVGL